MRRATRLLLPARAVLLAAVLAAPACVPPEALGVFGSQARLPDDPSLLPEDRPDPRAPIGVAALAHEVETVRRLSLKEPVRAVPLPRDAFVDRLLGARSESKSAGSGGPPMFWTAFGFAPASAPLGAMSRRVVEERVLGFYALGDRTLYLRGGTADGERIVPEADGDRAVLAHEIEHALQDQTFGLHRGPLPWDVSLAYRALAEGDATLTEIAVQAQRRPDGEHWVSRVAANLRSDAAQELLRRGGLRSRELAGTPALLQRATVFPYHDGLAFVADLYRAGGLPLVDRAFSHPPRSTEQVLHPDRYLAGDDPVAVPPPAPPDGWTARGSGTMGERTIGMLLGQCIARAAGARAATGWGGDTYAFAADGQGAVAVLWSTIWDDEASAARFEEASVARSACVKARPAEGGLATDVAVVRQGRRVAIVQGLGAERDAAQAAVLLAVPVDVPVAQPPFGAVVIPALVVPEQAFLKHGRFERGAWVSDPLGIRMPIPEDFRPIKDSELEASMEHLGNANAAFTMLMASPGMDTDRLFMRRWVKARRDELAAKEQELDYVATGPVKVGGRDAPSYTWRSSKRVSFELVFVPACRGHGTVVLELMWGGDDGSLAIDDWVKRFVLPAETSDACVTLERTLD